MNALSAIRMIDQALAAMTGPRPAASGDGLAAGTDAASGSTRMSFEQWLASQSGGDAPTGEALAGQGEDVASGDALTDDERDDGKSAGELNPAEHPLLAPYMPVPDAAAPVTGASDGAPVPQAAPATLGTAMPPVAPQVVEASANGQAAQATPTDAANTAPGTAPANARPEYIPVASAARVALPAAEQAAATVAGEGEAVALQPVDSLNARTAAYSDQGTPRSGATGGADTAAIATAIARTAPAAIVGAGVNPLANNIPLRRDGSAAAPLATVSGTLPEGAASLAARGQVSTPAPAPAPAPAVAAMAAMVEPTGKAKDTDSDIGDSSAFGLDAIAKAATGPGDSAQLFGTHHTQAGTSPQAIAGQAAGQAVPMDRAILDFSQGLAWIDRLASEISAMGSKDGKLSFDLNPESLGKLTVSMHKGETGINLALHVTNHDAANILAASHTQLKQELSNAGLQLGSFDIGNQPAPGGDGNGGSASRTGSDARAADQAGEVAADGAAEILGARPDSGVRFA